jgi:hypothetical protein
MTTTTPADLAAQITDLVSRWNAHQDQLDDWLAGDPAGGPNGDGRYPLTNSDGTTRLFLCLPAIISTVEGPAAQAEQSADDAQAAATAAQESRDGASFDRGTVAALRDEVVSIRALIETQRQEVAAMWSDVRFWYENAAESAAITDENVLLSEAIYNELAELRDRILQCACVAAATFDSTATLFSSDAITMDAG